MAIDDNMSYELTGSQVKDLAARIKGNTKLAKDLVGGAPRVSKRINVFQLTDYDEATEISNQIDNPDVYPALLIQLLGYAFYDVNWGKYLNRYEIGEAIADNCDFVYFSTTGDDGFVQKIIVGANSNYDGDADTYSPSFLIYEINTKTPYGGGKMHTLSLNENTQTGLEDWYITDLSTWTHEPAFVIQRMTSAEAQEIADKINADNPGAAVTSSQVSSYMKFVCRNTATGEMIQTASSFRQALFRGTNDIYFLPSMAGASANMEIMTYKGSNTRTAGFNLVNMFTSEITPYNIVAPSSSYGTNAEYMWYIAERDDVYTIQLPYGYPDDTAVDVSTDTPEAVFQTAVDANGNLYMASGNTAASDWKQINNAEGNIISLDQGPSSSTASGTVIKSSLTQAEFGKIAAAMTSGSPALFRFDDNSGDAWFYRVSAITPVDSATVVVDVLYDGGLSWQHEGLDKLTFMAYAPGTTYPNGTIVLLASSELGSESYSTTEQATGGTWIDGKTIYKKTVNTGALSNSAEKLTPHNISNLYRVIKLEGYAYRSTDGKTIPIPFAGSAGGDTSIDVSVVNGNIRFLNAADMAAFAESNVTLYYTKSS